MPRRNPTATLRPTKFLAKLAPYADYDDFQSMWRDMAFAACVAALTASGWPADDEKTRKALEAASRRRSWAKLRVLLRQCGSPECVAAHAASLHVGSASEPKDLDACAPFAYRELQVVVNEWWTKTWHLETMIGMVAMSGLNDACAALDRVARVAIEVLASERRTPPAIQLVLDATIDLLDNVSNGMKVRVPRNWDETEYVEGISIPAENVNTAVRLMAATRWNQYRLFGPYTSADEALGNAARIMARGALQSGIGDPPELLRSDPRFFAPQIGY